MSETLNIIIGSAFVTTTGNDTSVSLLFTKDGVGQTTGTVAISLLDDEGEALTGGGNPVSLAHVGTPDGRWTGVIQDTLVWPPSRRGYAVVTFSDGTNQGKRTVAVTFVEAVCA